MAGSQEENSATPEVLAAQQFRERLRQAIKASGLTQRFVAGRLEIRPATVTDWLTSEGLENLPSGETLLRLAGMLKVNQHWLWTGDGDRNARPGDADALLTEFRRLAVDPVAGAAELRARATSAAQGDELAALSRERTPGRRAGKPGRKKRAKDGPGET